jgi:hypothetical protein
MLVAIDAILNNKIEVVCISGMQQGLADPEKTLCRPASQKQLTFSALIHWLISLPLPIFLYLHEKQFGSTNSRNNKRSS